MSISAAALLNRVIKTAEEVGKTTIPDVKGQSRREVIQSVDGSDVKAMKGQVANALEKCTTDATQTSPSGKPADPSIIVSEREMNSRMSSKKAAARIAAKLWFAALGT